MGFFAQPFEPDVDNSAVGKLVWNWYDSCLTALALFMGRRFFFCFDIRAARSWHGRRSQWEKNGYDGRRDAS